MDWDDLKVFLQAAQHGTLTAASRKLKISVATASRRLDRLEEALGKKLFTRHASGLTLTAEGRRMLERATSVEASVSELLRVMVNEHQDQVGRVRVSTIETLASHVLAPSLGDFSASYPGIELTIRAQTRIVNLSNGDADLALRVVKPREDRVIGARVATIGYGLYASEDYLSRRGYPKAPQDDLRGHALISWDVPMELMPEMTWLLMRADRQDVILRLSSATAMQEAAIAGAGIALLPDFMAKPQLVELVGAHQLPTRDVWLVMHEDLRHAAAIRAVADHITRVARQVIGAPRGPIHT